MDAQEVVDRLGLRPHPEGGWYAETWRDPPADGSRGRGTAIYFLLREGERSHWHRVDADEVWLFHAGAPLVLSTAERDTSTPVERLLGVDLAADQHPQLRVPADHWQAATSTGAWTLVSCTVCPAFTFDGFELAPPGWSPG